LQDNDNEIGMRALRPRSEGGVLMSLADTAGALVTAWRRRDPRSLSASLMTWSASL